jgi:hypothetical protein
MKTMIMILLMTITLNPFAMASEENVIQLSYSVSQYLKENVSSMSDQELLWVESLLNRILDGAALTIRAICTPNTHKLISASGRVIYDYALSPQCQKGLKQLNQYRAICTPNTHKLISASGQLIFDYGLSSQCLAGLKQL